MVRLHVPLHRDQFAEACKVSVPRTMLIRRSDILETRQRCAQAPASAEL